MPTCTSGSPEMVDGRVGREIVELRAVDGVDRAVGQLPQHLHMVSGGQRGERRRVPVHDHARAARGMVGCKVQQVVGEVGAMLLPRSANSKGRRGDQGSDGNGVLHSHK
jgi:hypothetical protein